MPSETQPDFVNSEVIREWLRKPFAPELIGKLPATSKRPALDYVGHAVVTDRLNKTAPDWTYDVAPVVVDGSDGWPHVLAVFGTMTIGGVSRQEVGAVDKPSTYGQELKEAISDFIRRGAMRFGVAIDLWSKEDLAAGAGGGGSIPSFAPRPASEQSVAAERVNGLESDTAATGHTSGLGSPDATPEPGEVLAGEGDRSTGKAAKSNSPANDTATVHIHEWSDHWTDQNGKVQSARPGWVVCSSCGKADPAKKVLT